MVGLSLFSIPFGWINEWTKKTVARNKSIKLKNHSAVSALLLIFCAKLILGSILDLLDHWTTLLVSVSSHRISEL